MECRTLDLTSISAKDLKDIQLIGKQDLYALVSINGDVRTKQKTKVDKDCGTKPKWKQNLKLTVDEAAARENRLTLVIQIMADRPIAGDKLVGEVNIPVKALLDQNKISGEEKKLTYDVRLPNGKTKGSLKISFKFGEKFTYGSSSAPPPVSADHKTMDNNNNPVTAYPPGHGGQYPPSAGPSGYPPPGSGGYPPAVHGYPPQQGGYGGYPPPQQGYPAPQQGYPGGYPQAPGYGYQGYPPPGQYGYPQQAYGKPQKPKKHGGSGGLGLGLGLGAGLLGGLLVGEAVSDIADSVDDMGDMGGDFDF